MKNAVTLYLIHAEIPYKHAGHYLGVTQRDTLLPRIQEHLRGHGCELVPLFAQALGITTAEDVVARMVVASWPGTRGEERRLKNRGGLSRICPTCRAKSGLVPYISNTMRRANGTASSTHQD